MGQKPSTENRVDPENIQKYKELAELVTSELGAGSSSKQHQLGALDSILVTSRPVKVKLCCDKKIKWSEKQATEFIQHELKQVFELNEAKIDQISVDTSNWQSETNDGTFSTAEEGKHFVQILNAKGLTATEPEEQMVLLAVSERIKREVLVVATIPSSGREEGLLGACKWSEHDKQNAHSTVSAKELAMSVALKRLHAAAWDKVRSEADMIMDTWYDVVLVFPPSNYSEIHNLSQEKVEKRKKKTLTEERLCILKALDKSGLEYETSIDTQAGKDVELVKISASYMVLQKEAERIKLLKEWHFEEDEKIYVRKPKMFGSTKMQANWRWRPYTAENKNNFAHTNKSDSGREFDSLSRQRLIYSIMEDQDAGCGLNLDVLVRSRVLMSYFSLHGQLRSKLFKKWMECRAEQPLNEVRRYLGERFAIYFAFLGHYTDWLGGLTAMALVTSWFQLQYGFDTVMTPIYAVALMIWSALMLETWKQYNNELCFNWGLVEAARGSGDVALRPDFIRSQNRDKWKKGKWVSSQIFLQYDQKMQAYIDNCHCEGALKKELQGSESPVFSDWSINFWRVLSWLPVLLITVLVLVGTFWILMYRALLQHDERFGVILGGLSGGLINAFFISFMNIVGKMVAKWCVNMENHRTSMEHENALIAKVFIFVGINSYSSLFYIAFLKETTVVQDKVFEIMGFRDHCKEDDCMQELFTHLLMLSTASQLIGAIIEFVLPLLYFFLNVMSTTKKKMGSQLRRSMGAGEGPQQGQGAAGVQTTTMQLIKQSISSMFDSGQRSVAESSQPSASTHSKTRWGLVGAAFAPDNQRKLRVNPTAQETQVQDELQLPRNYGTFDEYMEMMIQFGYVTMFAAAFPLASLTAFLNNIVEIRVDAYKLLMATQRPRYSAALNMGTWYHILEILSVISIFTNVAIICYTSKTIQREWGLTSTELWCLGISLEHLLLGIKFILSIVVPDTPSHVVQAQAWAAIEKDMAEEGERYPELADNELLM